MTNKTPKNRDKEKLRHTGNNSFIVQIKSEDVHALFAKDFETRFDASIQEVDTPLPVGKNKKKIKLVKYELGGKIMKKFGQLRPKMYSDLIDFFSISKFCIYNI